MPTQALQPLGWFGASYDALNMPAIGLLFGFWAGVFTPLTNWASRVAERRADEYAIPTASLPAAFVAQHD